jgi:hypothetical protein
MPALPGAQKSLSHSGEAAIDQHSACSRPPDPTTKIFIFSSLDYPQYFCIRDQAYLSWAHSQDA